VTILNALKVEAIEGKHLRCCFQYVYGFDWQLSLVTSRTLALHMLWESLWLRLPDRAMTYEEAVQYRERAPLFAALDGPTQSGHNLTDEDWNRVNVGRFLACVGLSDFRGCDEAWLNTRDERWDDPAFASEIEVPTATLELSVTDERFLSHLVVGAEWDSTSYPHDDPITFEPAWRTETVLAVARRAYDAREFGALPILADALQDAGCDSADLLNHLRDPHAEHVRGCWALDLVLGKE
jgi:hypothetical protein